MAFTLNQDRSDTGNHPDSYYAATRNPAPELDPLDGSCRADVAIVGGGYTGLSCALHLAKSGYKVVLLEARKVGWGASGRNGGHLGSGQRKDQIALEKMLGNATAHRLWDLAQDAKSLCRSLIAGYAIECDLKSGAAHPDHKPGYAAETRAYVDHLRNHYQYDQVGYLEADEMASIVGSDSYHGGSMDHGAGHLHPLNYVLGLAHAALQNGAILHDSTVVESYQEGNRIRLVTNRGSVEADAIAGEAEKFDLFGQLPTRVFPGGDWLRWPALVLGMSYYALRDRL